MYLVSKAYDMDKAKLTEMRHFIDYFTALMFLCGCYCGERDKPSSGPANFIYVLSEENRVIATKNNKDGFSYGMPA